MEAIKKSTFDLELLKQELSEKDMMVLLFNLTGHLYTFAVGSDLRWGNSDEIVNSSPERNPEGFYQLMPKTIDDGFFDWYCYNREDYQFFETQENCVLHFIFYWSKWEKLDKPKPF